MVRRASPVRTCVGCRARVPASELLRVVAVEHEVDGSGRAGRFSLVPDPGRRRSGRGAHLHPDPACLALAERRRAFGRALRVPGVVDAGPLVEYLRALGTAAGEGASRHPDKQGRTTNMSTR